MNIEELISRGKHDSTFDLTSLNDKVLVSLGNEGLIRTKVSPFKRLCLAVVESPVLALTAAGLLFLVPLHGVVNTLGLAEPVCGYILSILIP